MLLRTLFSAYLFGTTRGRRTLTAHSCFTAVEGVEIALGQGNFNAKAGTDRGEESSQMTGVDDMYGDVNDCVSWEALVAPAVRLGTLFSISDSPLYDALDSVIGDLF